MAHYAFIDENNIVTNVITGREEDEIVDGISDWETYYSEIVGQKCLRTSWNTLEGEHRAGGTPFRGNFAGVGMIYHEDIDAFVDPKPFSSWVLNEEKARWEAPVPIPEENARYSWNEDFGIWEKPSNT
jgi:hypothetical protein